MNYVININHRIITSCYRRQKHFFSQLICNKNNYKVIQNVNNKNINYIIQSQRNFSSNNNIINIEANPDIRSILDNGFVIFDKDHDNKKTNSNASIDPTLCQTILDSCMKDYEEQSKTWKYKLTRIFDIVNTPKNRHSIKLKMNDKLKQLLHHVLYGNKRRQQFYETLYGPSSILVEFSLLLTFPGAPSQALHSDISYQALESQHDNYNLPGLSSTFVAIQDVDRDM